MDGLYFDVNKAADPKPKSDERGSSKLGKDEFLKLMMAQLSQQDPTAPSDSNAFIAQLAQFTSLEQMQNVNTSLQSLLIGQASTNNNSAINLVGKDVLYKTDEITLEKGATPSASAKLSAAADQVTAVITDDSGKVIRTLHLGGHDAGEVEVPWDGRDEAGNTAKPGKYKVSITASDSKGNNVSVEQRSRGRVTGVSFEKGYPEVILGDQHLKMSDIVEINERNTP
jgi:flagellar basal-body rod modification protein FlgD